MVDPTPAVSGNGISMLKAQGIEVLSGLLSQDAQKLNVGFIKKMTHSMPYVRCKLASSLDGKTAMKSGESQWITSSEAREDVQRLRAQSCAVITGCDSVLFDNAKMNVRWNALGELKNNYPESSIRQPVRVIIDSKNRLTPDLAIFNEKSPIIIFTQCLEKQHQWPHFVKHIVVPTVTIENEIQEKKLDLKAVLSCLAENGMNDILLESGALLAGAFIEQNLVDELILYQAPMLIGSEGKSLMSLPGIDKLADAKALNITDITRVGVDIRITSALLSV
jgi:diaminohydroxyphosphoribosylaminopyrimidine deaminase/5-amino-6-(5-phosphoribosylamino)uracil reductase